MKVSYFTSCILPLCLLQGCMPEAPPVFTPTKNVLVMGDSLVYGAGGMISYGFHSGNQPYTAIVVGMPGYGTFDADEYWVNRINMVENSIKLDYVVVNLSYNDIQHPELTAHQKEDMGKILEAIGGTPVYWLLPHQSACNLVPAGTCDAFKANLQSFVPKYDLHFVDFDAFLAKQEVAFNGLTTDGVHLNDAGSMYFSMMIGSTIVEADKAK